MELYILRICIVSFLSMLVSGKATKDCYNGSFSLLKTVANVMDDFCNSENFDDCVKHMKTLWADQVHDDKNPSDASCMDSISRESVCKTENRMSFGTEHRCCFAEVIRSVKGNPEGKRFAEQARKDCRKNRFD